MASIANSLRRRLQRSTSRKSLKEVEDQTVIRPAEVGGPTTPIRSQTKRSSSTSSSAGRPVSAHSASTSGYRSTSVEDEELPPRQHYQHQHYYQHQNSVKHPQTPDHAPRKLPVTPPRTPLRRAKSMYAEKPEQRFSVGRKSVADVRQEQPDVNDRLYYDPIKPMTRTMSCCGALKATNIYQQQNKHQQPFIENAIPQVYDTLLYDNNSGAIYKKGKLLGKGGFAKCYELICQKTGVIYAGKIIPKNQISKSHQKDKISREIELHRLLCNDHVVSFKSHFEDENNVYIVLELCNRKSLVHVLKQRRTLTEPEVRYYVMQLVNATRYIHSRHVIHRDLKLGNLLLNDDMQVKVSDFGLATRIEREGELKLTVCGTPNYISPEVLTKKGHSYQVDLWAIGCIMYAMLVGRPPFETATLKETYSRITTNTYHLPSSLISAPARSLIRRLLSPNPAQRPSLRGILDDPFMTSGYCPAFLPTSCCDRPPKFSIQRIIPKPKSVAASASCETLDSLAAGKSCEQLTSATSVTSSSRCGRRLPSSTGQHLSTAAKMRSHAAIATTKVKRMSLAEPKGHAAASHLFGTLVSTLDSIQTIDSTVTPPCQNPHLSVTKWVDYSNRYGFGFQLSDKSVGVLFNDSTRMLLSPDASTVQYNDLSNKVLTFTIDSAESNSYRQKTTLLLYFSQYMDENLIIGANNNNNNNNNTTTTNNNHINSVTSRRGSASSAVAPGNATWKPTATFLKQWFRTDRAIVMYLNNGTLQVNFFGDHTKVIICIGAHQDYLITYINRKRLATSYSLSSLLADGCDSDIIERLHYSKRVLDRIINNYQ